MDPGDKKGRRLKSSLDVRGFGLAVNSEARTKAWSSEPRLRCSQTVGNGVGSGVSRASVVLE